MRRGECLPPRKLERWDWYSSNTFHHEQFRDMEDLLDRKRREEVTVSVCLPSLNEAPTIGEIVRVIREELMESFPLVDQLCVVDGGSKDGTAEIAVREGAEVYLQEEILPWAGEAKGKGDALWRSLYCTRGDVIVWVDSDIKNFHPRFVYGLLGPLLYRREIRYVKGFYRRPIKDEHRLHHTGGGRVTELVARPMLSLFYPELGALIQPLSGEYAGDRRLLEQVPFFTRYGVETGLIVDIFTRFGMRVFGQVDLVERQHRNQPLPALGIMSFEVLQALFIRLEEQGKIKLMEEFCREITQVDYKEGEYLLEKREVTVEERPPMVEVDDYVRRFGKSG
jgi:glucosyl-3-phosphoglycerate synthase